MSPLHAKILSVLLSLPVYGEDRNRPEEKRHQLEQVAASIAQVAETPPDAALLIASGWEETGWSLRIHEGRCRPQECDHGRARGPWQLQRNGMSRESWELMIGVENTDAQARTAAKRLVFYRRQCGDTTGTIARYFGLGCHQRTEAVWRRFRTYRKILEAFDVVGDRS
jgi:hypothetical protein